jgi:hypothetical protein
MSGEIIHRVVYDNYDDFQHVNFTILGIILMTKLMLG